jgi:hypothetical protein
MSEKTEKLDQVCAAERDTCSTRGGSSFSARATLPASMSRTETTIQTAQSHHQTCADKILQLISFDKTDVVPPREELAKRLFGHVPGPHLYSACFTQGCSHHLVSVACKQQHVQGTLYSSSVPRWRFELREEEVCCRWTLGVHATGRQCPSNAVYVIYCHLMPLAAVSHSVIHLSSST